MKVWQELRHFPHSTLIIVSNHVHAHFYHIEGEDIEEIENLYIPRERRQDTEGSKAASDHTRVGNPSADVTDTPRLQSFMKNVIAITRSLIPRYGIKHIDIVMCADVIHFLRLRLPQPIAVMLRRELHLDLTHESPLTIVERLLHEAHVPLPSSQRRAT